LSTGKPIKVKRVLLCVLLSGYDNKEQAEEAVFFHKEDEKLLKKLLSKVRAQAEQYDSRSASEARAAELSALNEIVGSKLSDVEKEGNTPNCN
jgi:hypothetical protein